MKMTVLALTTACLLAGGAATTASAQTTYYTNNGVTTYVSHDVDEDDADDNDVDYYYVNNDVDNDGIANQYDRYDDRYPRTVTSTVIRNGFAIDRDCDGVPDRPGTYVRDFHDADCDDIPDRSDKVFGQRYTAQPRNPPLYTESSGPRPTRYQTVGYETMRYNVGAYLPASYYGDPYYVDYVQYDLSAPPYGYRWNRVGNDAYLISTDNGLIAEVRYDYFH